MGLVQNLNNNPLGFRKGKALGNYRYTQIMRATLGGNIYSDSELEEVLLFKAFDSVPEGHLKRSKMDTQTFCLFLGNLVKWLSRLSIFRPVIIKSPHKSV